MRILQGSFPRLQDRFIYEDRGEQRISLKCFVLLFDLLSRLVGISQIRNAYMPLPLLERSATDALDIEGGQGGA